MFRTLSAATITITALFTATGFAAQDHGGMDHDAIKHGDSMEQMDKCSQPMGEGVINTLEVKKSKINLTHKPIEAIGWPEMTMDFTVQKPVDLSAYGVGENVHFLLKLEKAKSYSIAAMCSLDVDGGAHEACMAQMHKVAMAAAAEKDASCAMDDMSKMDHSSHH
ncbi:copper-binding protein [Hyphococcus sp.]|uniref:copper-binding protein n=1 Tax=Hyphococcus sp. TaxID=2038636 RepID=UPI00208C8DC9|nr:MAG: hypothetical protein DHS20C04_05810 [Marinicaulis sp.]